MDHPIRIPRQFRIMAVLAAIVIILGVLALLAVTTTTRMIRDRDWIAHAQGILAELQEARALVDDAEDQQRGFLISGDVSLLPRFEASLERFVTKLDIAPHADDRRARSARSAGPGFAGRPDQVHGHAVGHRHPPHGRAPRGPGSGHLGDPRQAEGRSPGHPARDGRRRARAAPEPSRPGPHQRSPGGHPPRAAARRLSGLPVGLLLDDLAKPQAPGPVGTRAPQEPGTVRAGGARVQRRNLGLGHRDRHHLLLAAVEIADRL